MLDNKAQLAYVLAHEAAHVAKRHWQRRALLELAQPEWTRLKAENLERSRWWRPFVVTAVGTAAGYGLARGTDSPLAGVAGGVATAAIVASYLNQPPQPLIVDWRKEEEDEADELAFKALMNAKINVREIPALFLALRDAARLDERTTLGFLGDPGRVNERYEHVQSLLKAAEEALKT